MKQKFGAFSSSVDPEKLSGTVKAISASLLPVIHLFTGITLVNEQVDKVIDAVFILITAGMALAGYIRSKRVMGGQIVALKSLIEK